jgi:hypothetical protein
MSNGRKVVVPVILVSAIRKERRDGAKRKAAIQIMKKTLTVAAVLTVSLSAWSQMSTYCSGSGGNIACTTYDQGASTQSYCTSIGDNLSCTTFGNVNDYSHVTVQQNYEAGSVIGAAIGGSVVAAIRDYREHKHIKQDKQDKWNQFVQNTLSTTGLACETDPKHEGGSIEECREQTFGINQFVHRHQKDFVMDGYNMVLLYNALVSPNYHAALNETMEQAMERALLLVNKRQLDKKPYVGGVDGRRLLRPFIV